MRGGVGEKALRQILDNAYRVADRCLPQDAAVIRSLADDINRSVNELCDLRQAGKGNAPQAEQLAREIRDKLGNLERAVTKAVIGVDKAGHQAAHTVSYSQILNLNQFEIIAFSSYQFDKNVFLLFRFKVVWSKHAVGYKIHPLTIKALASVQSI